MNSIFILVYLLRELVICLKGWQIFQWKWWKCNRRWFNISCRTLTTSYLINVWWYRLRDDKKYYKFCTESHSYYNFTIFIETWYDVWVSYHINVNNFLDGSHKLIYMEHLFPYTLIMNHLIFQLIRKQMKNMISCFMEIDIRILLKCIRLLQIEQMILISSNFLLIWMF